MIKNIFICFVVILCCLFIASEAASIRRLFRNAFSKPESTLSIDLRKILNGQYTGELSITAVEIDKAYSNFRSTNPNFSELSRGDWSSQYVKDEYKARVRKFIHQNRALISQDKSAIITILDHFRNWDWRAVEPLIASGDIIRSNLKNLHSIDSVGTTVLHEVIKGPENPRKRRSENSIVLQKWILTILNKNKELGTVKDKDGLDYLELARELYYYKPKKEKIYGELILRTCQRSNKSFVGKLKFEPILDQVCSDAQIIRSTIFANLLWRTSPKTLNINLYNKELGEMLLRALNDAVVRIFEELKGEAAAGAQEAFDKDSKVNKVSPILSSTPRMERKAQKSKKTVKINPIVKFVSDYDIAEPKIFLVDLEAMTTAKQDRAVQRMTAGTAAAGTAGTAAAAAAAAEEIVVTPSFVEYVNKVLRRGHSVSLMLSMLKQEDVLKCGVAVNAIVDIFREQDFDRIRFVMNHVVRRHDLIEDFAALYVYGSMDGLKLPVEPIVYFEILDEMMKHGIIHGVKMVNLVKAYKERSLLIVAVDSKGKEKYKSHFERLARVIIDRYRLK